MDHHQTLSAYLLAPARNRHPNQWRKLKIHLLSVYRAHPHLGRQVTVALFIWSSLAGTLSFLMQPHTLPGQTHMATTASTPTSQPVALAAATRAPELPSGPTGQLLPPGTMAPDHTYPNSYAPGQCTWYVASRRPVPSHWGNAENWYWRALSSGWSVGTLPAVAAIAWTPTGAYGHVALVEQVSADNQSIYISEMNFHGPYIKSKRWVAAAAFKYIY